MKEMWRGIGAGRRVCNDVMALSKFIYLSDRVSAGGECVASMPTRS